MGYLMRNQSNVFYNSKYFKPNNVDEAKDFRENEYFPPEWRRMVMKNGKRAFVQNRLTPAIVI
jgi:hypothetical protein